jgi:hypothetical protein
MGACSLALPRVGALSQSRLRNRALRLGVIIRRWDFDASRGFDDWSDATLPDRVNYREGQVGPTGLELGETAAFRH